MFNRYIYIGIVMDDYDNSNGSNDSLSEFTQLKRTRAGTNLYFFHK